MPSRNTGLNRTVAAVLAIAALCAGTFLVWLSAGEQEAERRVVDRVTESRAEYVSPSPKKSSESEPRHPHSAHPRVIAEVAFDAPENAPAAGASVEVRTPRAGGRRAAELVGHATTGDDGRATCELAGVRPGAIAIVRATLPGFRAAEVALDVPADSVSVVHITLRSGIRLAGRVVTDSKSPVPGVQVVAIPMGSAPDAPSRGEFQAAGEPWERVQTASDGTFTMAVSPTRRYLVRAQARNWIHPDPLIRTVSPGAAEEIELVVYPARLVRVRLLDKQSNRPIWKPHVILSPNDATVRFQGSDAGRILPDRYFDGSEWQVAGELVAATDAEEAVYEGVVWWRDPANVPARISITVRNVIGYRSVAFDATVQAMDVGGGCDEVRLERSQSGPEPGRLVVAEPQANSVLANHSESRLIRLEIGGEWRWDFIRGFRRADGKWVFENVPAGKWKACVGLAGGLWSFPITVSVVEGAESHAQVEYPAAGGVRVTAADADGARLRGFDLVLHEFDARSRIVGKQIAVYRSGPGGRKHDEGELVCLPAGAYRIGIVLPGYLTDTRVIAIESGEVADVRATLERQGP